MAHNKICEFVRRRVDQTTSIDYTAVGKSPYRSFYIVMRFEYTYIDILLSLIYIANEIFIYISYLNSVRYSMQKILINTFIVINILYIFIIYIIYILCNISCILHDIV